MSGDGGTHLLSRRAIAVQPPRSPRAKYPAVGGPCRSKISRRAMKYFQKQTTISINRDREVVGEKHNDRKILGAIAYYI